MSAQMDPLSSCLNPSHFFAVHLLPSAPTRQQKAVSGGWCPQGSASSWEHSCCSPAVLLQSARSHRLQPRSSLPSSKHSCLRCQELPWCQVRDVRAKGDPAGRSALAELPLELSTGLRLLEAGLFPTGISLSLLSVYPSECSSAC